MNGLLHAIVSCQEAVSSMLQVLCNAGFVFTWPPIWGETENIAEVMPA
jgi:hypothetical protein